MKTMLSFLMFVTLASTSQASYSDKLKSVQDRVNLNFCPSLTDVEKINVVNRLHNFLNTTANADVYGAKKLVQALYVDCPIRFSTENKIKAYSRLRGNSLLVDFNLQSLNLFEARISLEQSILEQLKAQKDETITVNRQADALSQFSGSNEDHLQLLTYVKNILPQYINADFRAQLDQIVISDSNNYYAKASIAVGNSWYNRNKKVLHISVGHLDLQDGEGLVLNEQGFESLVKLSLQKGLTSVDTLLLEKNQVQQSLTNLDQFLNSENLALFQAHGVSGVLVKDDPASAQNLFVNGVLTLGPTEEKINFVVDLLFK